jgi:glycosyltransferase involved in cell wall biosynthesis
LETLTSRRNFHEGLKTRFNHLWQGGFPVIQPRWHMPNDTLSHVLPFENRLSKSKRRLVMAIPWLKYGGADKFNLDLLQQLTLHGWEITIITTATGDNSWLPQFARFTPDIFILSNFLRLVDYPRFLRYIIQSRAADALYISNSEFTYLTLPYLRAQFPHLAIVDMCHMEEENWKNGGHARASVEYQEMLDLTWVSSRHLQNWMVERGAQTAKIRVLYTNVDPGLYCPQSEAVLAIRSELGLEPQACVILYAARLVEQKQPHVFAQTLLNLKQQNVPFIALVAGDGPERSWLEKFIREHHLQAQVRLLGVVSNDRVRQLMQASDVFFLPSKMEGISLALFEAMACGLPVVAARVGGQSELVTSDCGFLLDPSDESTEAAQYATILADLIKSPDQRRQMGEAGRARIEAHFRLESMGDIALDLLAEAQTRNQACPPPAPSSGLALACAALAVEYTRLFYLADQLWLEREQAANAASHLSVTSPVPLRTRLYFFLRRHLLVFYQAGVQKRWIGLVQLKALLKRYLVTSVRESS